LGGLAVTVAGGKAQLRGSETIAGSTLTLDAAIRHSVTVAGLSLGEAVRAATLSPSEMLNRTDIGRLTPGARADLAVLDTDLRVTDVLHGGTWVRDMN
jgi:N-acetylglucosamine-6-phosphate deacetylase